MSPCNPRPSNYDQLKIKLLREYKSQRFKFALDTSADSAGSQLLGAPRFKTASSNAGGGRLSPNPKSTGLRMNDQLRIAAGAKQLALGISPAGKIPRSRNKSENQTRM